MSSQIALVATEPVRADSPEHGPAGFAATVCSFMQTTQHGWFFHMSPVKRSILPPALSSPKARVTSPPDRSRLEMTVPTAPMVPSRPQKVPSRPRKISMGRVSNEPPPAMTLITPATKPTRARKNSSISMRWVCG